MWRIVFLVLRALIGKFIVVYIDDILIYNKYMNEHIDHLHDVFNAQCDARLFGNIEKCTFCTN
jgi:hypothetical protein